MLALFVAIFGLILLIPTPALAWGPITHIVHGSTILANLTSLPAALQAILEAYPDRYLYGCIGADIIQAKAYTRSLATHCHSWPVAWTLVESAQTDAEKAFAWGYLTHLSADIVSHNHFVPSSLLRSFESRAANHAYWEARADGLQRRRHWQEVREVLRGQYDDCDALVERVIHHTLFSFKTNKRIFDSLMALHKFDRWQALVGSVNRRSRYSLTRDAVERYNDVCIASAVDLLTNREASFTQEQDPTGREVLERAIKLRRQLRALKRRNRLSPDIEREAVSGELIAAALARSAAA
jgi:Zinc dependent phospholipase C